jgi:hypothetical protein
VIACIKSVSSGERSPIIATSSGADFEVLAARWLVSLCWVYSRAHLVHHRRQIMS